VKTRRDVAPYHLRPAYLASSCGDPAASGGLPTTAYMGRLPWVTAAIHVLHVTILSACARPYQLSLWAPAIPDVAFVQRLSVMHSLKGNVQRVPFLGRKDSGVNLQYLRQILENASLSQLVMLRRVATGDYAL
jgi:hypothetical protein